MEAYVRELLALRYDSPLMKQLSTLNDGLLRRVLSIVAHARYLCPNVRPSVAVSVHPSSVSLIWRWERCILAIIVPEQENLFDEPQPDEEIEAFFTDRATGEFWRVLGFTRVGSGVMSPLFPPQVEQKLLEAHTSSVNCGLPEHGKPYINSFRFKRLFPDLQIPIDDDEYTECGQESQPEKKDRLWNRIIQSLTPALEAIGTGIGRYFVEEAVPKWIHRRRSSRHD